MNYPIHRKATAVWLVDNTVLTFKQIADFTGLHELEVQGIADGEVATGIKGFDPIVNNQLDQEMITKAEADPKLKLMLKSIPEAQGERKRKGPKYTPLSKRQDKPSAIAWLVKNHPELTDGQIGKLVGTTKPTINSIRERTHWNISNITPVDPVALGLCSQIELDEAVRKSAKRRDPDQVLGAGETLLSTDESLADGAQTQAEKNFAELENFSFTASNEPTVDEKLNADDYFNIAPSDDDQPEDEVEPDESVFKPDPNNDVS